MAIRPVTLPPTRQPPRSDVRAADAGAKVAISMACEDLRRNVRRGFETTSVQHTAISTAERS
jgi:hypothetical protein